MTRHARYGYGREGMSSSIDAGHHANEAVKERRRPCPRGGEHDWEVHFPQSPSRWDVCKKCGEIVYWK